MAVPKSTKGLAYLSSLEKMPKRPALRSSNAIVEMEKWISELENYLRRLYGLLTADNFLITIVESGGALQFSDLWFKISPTTVVTEFLTNDDCRGRWILVWATYPTGTPQDTALWATFNLAPGAFMNGIGYTGTTFFSSVSSNGTTFAIQLDSVTGKIFVDIDGTGMSTTEDHLRFGILISTRKAVPDKVL